VSESNDRVIVNEQIKLTASAFNNVGVASIVTGVIVPIAAHLSATAGPGGRYWGWFVLLWFSAGFCFHAFGRLLLKGLRQ
jgi:hypothetical protein